MEICSSPSRELALYVYVESIAQVMMGRTTNVPLCRSRRLSSHPFIDDEVEGTMKTIM